MFYHHLSNRERNFLFLTIAILIIFFFYNFIIGPIISKWKDLNIQLISKKIKLEKDLKIIRNKTNIQKEFNIYSKYMKPLGSEDKEMAILMSDIENIARSSNISITNVKPQAVVSGNFYKEFSVNLDIEGKIEEITRFLYELSRPPYLLKAKRFEFNVKSGKDSRIKGFVLITKVAII